MGRVAKQHLLGVPRGSSPGALRNSWRLDVTVRPGALLWGAVRAGLAQAPHLGVEEEEGTCPDVGGCQRPKPVCVQPPRGDCVGGSLTQPGTESVDTCLFPSSTHPTPRLSPWARNGANFTRVPWGGYPFSPPCCRLRLRDSNEHQGCASSSAPRGLVGSRPASLCCAAGWGGGHEGSGGARRLKINHFVSASHWMPKSPFVCPHPSESSPWCSHLPRGSGRRIQG